MIASTIVGPASPCAAETRSGLERIATTVDAVDYVTYANMANLNVVMRGTLRSLIEVRLMCVGAGPTLDYADASAFLAELHEPIFNLWRQRHPLRNSKAGVLLTDKATILLHRPILSDIVLIPLCFP